MAFLFWYQELVIVTSHYKEDLTWLKKVRWPVIVIDKEGADPTCFPVETVIPNQGREASSYLRYIIDHYESLPRWIACIHGHETAWHQKRPYSMIDMLNHVMLRDGMFESLNGHFSLVPSSSGKHDIIQVNKHWNLIRDIVGDIPENDGVTDAGAQFIVSRDRILKHSKETYQRWYDALMNEKTLERSDIICTDQKARCTVDYELGAFFEYTWHVVFGEPWTMKPRAFPIHKKYRMNEFVPSMSLVYLQPKIDRMQVDLTDRLKNLSIQ